MNFRHSPFDNFALIIDLQFKDMSLFNLAFNGTVRLQPSTVGKDVGKGVKGEKCVSRCPPLLPAYPACHPPACTHLPRPPRLSVPCNYDLPTCLPLPTAVQLGCG